MDPEIFAIQAARNGNEQAWRELFEHHFDPLYRFCAALAAGRQDLAEEVAHDTFVTAARRIRRFDPGRATFRAWLIGIARNRHMAIQASEGRRKRHEQCSTKDTSGAVQPNTPDLFVHEALARLPSRYRIVLEAKYLRGLTMKQIAADDGASIEAIESLLRRARASFASAYEQIKTSR